MESLPGKRIVQSTFDDIVRENIEELDLEPEEAVSDAIEQFKAQVREYITLCVKRGCFELDCVNTGSRYYSYVQLNSSVLFVL